MYALHIIPKLFLQKPSKTPKSKDHVNALKRRIEQWKNGEFLQLLREASVFEKQLPKPETKKNINLISRKFCDYIGEANVNSTIKLLCNTMERGIPPLNIETIELLKLKYPEGREANEDAKLKGPLPTVENVIFDVINNSMVLVAMKIT